MYRHKRIYSHSLPEVSSMLYYRSVWCGPERRPNDWIWMKSYFKELYIQIQSFGTHQTVLYCDNLSRPSSANQNTELPGACQRGDQMIWLEILFFGDYLLSNHLKVLFARIIPHAMTPLDSYRLALDYSCYCLVLTQTFLDEEDDIINPKIIKFFKVWFTLHPYIYIELKTSQGRHHGTFFGEAKPICGRTLPQNKVFCCWKRKNATFETYLGKNKKDKWLMLYHKIF